MGARPEGKAKERRDQAHVCVWRSGGSTGSVTPQRALYDRKAPLPASASESHASTASTSDVRPPPANGRAADHARPSRVRQRCGVRRPGRRAGGNPPNRRRCHEWREPNRTPEALTARAGLPPPPARGAKKTGSRGRQGRVWRRGGRVPAGARARRDAPPRSQWPPSGHNEGAGFLHRAEAVRVPPTRIPWTALLQKKKPHSSCIYSPGGILKI